MVAAAGYPPTAWPALPLVPSVQQQPVQRAPWPSVVGCAHVAWPSLPPHAPRDRRLEWSRRETP